MLSVSRILKFFLNVSNEEQKQRFLERTNESEKNSKFSANNVKECEHWEDYINASENIFTYLAVGSIICHTLESLNLHYPTLSDAERQQLLQAKQKLEGAAAH